MPAILCTLWLSMEYLHEYVGVHVVSETVMSYPSAGGGEHWYASAGSAEIGQSCSFPELP